MCKDHGVSLDAFLCFCPIMPPRRYGLSTGHRGLALENVEVDHEMLDS